MKNKSAYVQEIKQNQIVVFPFFWDISQKQKEFENVFWNCGSG